MRSRIAAKLSLGAAGLALVGVLISEGVTGSWTVASLIIVPLAVLTGMYAVGVALLVPRLELARTLLQQIRMHRFENLKTAEVAGGDELNDLVHQVYQTGQVLESEIEDLKRIENYRQEFIGNVSHELKTPIFAVRGFAETLENGALEDPLVNRAFLQKILRNTDRLSNLVRDLGEISRIEHGELTLSLEPFALSVLCTEAVESVESMGAQQQVSVALALPADLPRVVGDPDLVRRIVINLVENAIKYNSEGGVVELVARRLPAGFVKVSVVDNGIGIPEELLPRITERFFRVDKSRSRSQGGTGLGLAIVKHLLAAHGRSLSVESKPGSGSTFSFSLPVEVGAGGTTSLT
jgi:two-component system, OmpR family, phosphate regulon sensor histidine kinase PhoR